MHARITLEVIAEAKDGNALPSPEELAAVIAAMSVVRHDLGYRIKYVIPVSEQR